MAFLPDTNLWIFLPKNPGGKLDAKVQSQPAADILLRGRIQISVPSRLFVVKF